MGTGGVGTGGERGEGRGEVSVHDVSIQNRIYAFPF